MRIEKFGGFKHFYCLIRHSLAAYLIITLICPRRSFLRVTNCVEQSARIDANHLSAAAAML